jgi:hypothetical protein
MAQPVSQPAVYANGLNKNFHIIKDNFAFYVVCCEHLASVHNLL